MKVAAIIGARPQFIKHYPFEREARGRFDLVTIHTGQHYDSNMSRVFFDQLGMKRPDYLLTLGGGSHGAQTGRMMIEIEDIIVKEKPEAMVVYGDTNSTLAGALVGAKLQIPIVHIEAGLRSYNHNMPEEINRVLTDHISTLLLVPSQKSVDNLQMEGLTVGVHVVGDIMKDLVEMCRREELIEDRPFGEDYFYATLHRPYNVDERERLIYVLESMMKVNRRIIFSAHPRTQRRIKEFGLTSLIKGSNIEIINPQPYFENLTYLSHSLGLITDSGGMQKEAYWLEKRCVTIRSETEWGETLEGRANSLIFEKLESLPNILGIEEVRFDKSLYGSGDASGKICSHILDLVYS